MLVVAKEIIPKYDYFEFIPGSYVKKVKESVTPEIEPIQVGEILKITKVKNKLLFFENRSDYIGYMSEDYVPVEICIQDLDIIKILTPDLYLINLEDIPYEIEGKIILTNRDFNDINCELSFKENPSTPVLKIISHTTDGIFITDLYESRVDYITREELEKKYVPYKGKSNTVEKAKIHENVILKYIINKMKRTNKQYISIDELQNILNNR